jgi:hypothetical protein
MAHVSWLVNSGATVAVNKRPTHIVTSSLFRHRRDRNHRNDFLFRALARKLWIEDSAASKHVGVAKVRQIVGDMNQYSFDRFKRHKYSRNEV